MLSHLISPEFRTKFQREVPLFLEIDKFSFNWKEAHMPKPSSIRSAVSIKHRLVTNRRTQAIDSTADAYTNLHIAPDK